MKPQIKPTAMPCETPERAKEVAELCEKHGIVLIHRYKDNDTPHIVNNYNGDLGQVGFVVNKSTYPRTLIPYHPELFMYNSGIFPEKWAVRDTEESTIFLRKLCAENGWYENDYLNDYNYEEGIYYLDSENSIQWTENKIPTDHVEVTLEELMFHYEGKTNSIEYTQNFSNQGWVIDNPKQVKCKSKSNQYDAITIGKTYNVKKVDEKHYFIICDNGNEIGFYRHLFETPTEQPKWEDRTRGGFEYKIYEEFEGRILGRVKGSNNSWGAADWYKAGSYLGELNNSHDFDLIPYNPFKAQLLAEKEELKKRIEEIERELK